MCKLWLISTISKFSRTRIPGLFFLVPLILLLISFPAAGYNNPDDIQIEASLGFGGYYKASLPNPVVIDITNSGDQFNGWAVSDLNGWIPPTFYQRPITIPPGATSHVEMGCYGCYDDNLCSVPVSVLSENGDTLSETTTQAWRLGLQDTIFLHIGQPQAPISNLMHGTNPGFLHMASIKLDAATGLLSYPPRIFPVIYEPGDIPENPLLLDIVGTIATNLSTWLSLDTDTQSTILEYVRHGGNLLVYWVPGVDPVDGWSGGLLLPAEPQSGTWEFTVESYAGLSESYNMLDALEGTIPEEVGNLDRDIMGRVIGNTLGNLETVAGPGLDYLDEAELPEFTQWQKPASYPAVTVSPLGQTDTVQLDGNEHPILVVRRLGSGHAGFAAFNPFDSNPSARDIPVNLLAINGLLNPNCPTRSLSGESVMAFKDLFDSRIQSFFRQGSITGSSMVMRWLEALGPALIYILVLPLIVYLARGRGNIILALFIIWSVIFTGIILYRRTNPTIDKVRVNEANLFWCEALAPSESVNTGTSRLYTALVYSANSSAPRTLTWNHQGGLADEYVYPQVWPYGYVTIEDWPVTSLPDLPLDNITFRSTTPAERTFVYHRSAPELSASGLLTVGPDRADFILDAELPFPIARGTLIVSSDNLWISHDLGELDPTVHIESPISEDEEIWRKDALFPDFDHEMPGRPSGRDLNDAGGEPGYILDRFWNIVYSMPVNRAQAYSESQESGRPYQAYVMLAASGLGSDIYTDAGEIERHGLSIIVISIPIEYPDEN